MSDTPRSRERFLLRTGLCLSGPLVWALHFGAVYGVGHVGCATSLVGGQAMRAAVVIATLAALLGAAVLFGICRRVQERTFFRPVSLWLLGLSAYGICATGLAAIFLPACAPLR